MTESKPPQSTPFCDAHHERVSRVWKLETSTFSANQTEATKVKSSTCQTTNATDATKLKRPTRLT